MRFDPSFSLLRTNVWTIASIIVAALSFGAPYTAASEADDHLIPADALFQRYRDFLAFRLANRLFNCGRVIVAPAFEGESSISVYCVSTKDLREKCRVTYTQASDNLWQQTSALQHLERASHIKISRIDAEISAKTAVSVREAFLRILKVTRPHVAREGDMRMLSVDATYTEFSLEVADRRQLSGQLDVSLVRQGEDVRNLLTLSRLLVDYSKASGPDRPHIEHGIKRTAAHVAGAR